MVERKTINLTKKRLKKWVKALRSGKYNQTVGALKEGNSYCCLGVLREIDPELKKLDCRKSFLGTKSEKSRVKGLDMNMQKHLANMNDSEQSFKNIASYIEKNVKPYNPKEKNE